MNCPVPNCSGAHSRSAHVQQRKRTGRVWPVGPRQAEMVRILAMRVSEPCARAIIAEGERQQRPVYQIVQNVLERWARRNPAG